MEKIKRWREKPILFVTEELKVKPDPWQEKGLIALEDPKKDHIGVQSCAGPGKTAYLGWVGWWWMSTQAEIGEHPKGAGVSITSDNLRDNLWAEFAKWQSRSEFLKRAFTWNAERIYANDHPETWFLSARSWPKSASAEEQGKTLSGMHSLFPIYLIDESGAIPMTVARAAEQSLTTAKRGLIVQAGNPVTREGMLHAAATVLRHIWHMIRITGDPDAPDRSPRIDIEWARQQIQTYGRGNPWVMAFILGEFPPSSINVLLGPEEVERAMAKVHMLEDYDYAQKRIGVDVAREGDDRTVLFPRQGLQAFPAVEMRNARGPEVAARVALAKEKWDWETCFVDDTGGWGGSVQDAMLQGNLAHVPVNFAGKADDPRYLNKRAEMWFRLAEWVKRGGCLPKDPDLVRELTMPTYTFVNGKFQIEPKEQIKKRLQFSPDKADALCFLAGTMIRTPTGDRKIESLNIGDPVETPMGPRYVVKLWESETIRITTAKFSNGAELKGKPDHEVFTWDRGWVRLDRLSLSNVIESDSKTRRLIWKFLRLWYIAVKPLGFKALVNIISQEGRIRRSDFFIEESIWTHAVRFLSGIISTTRIMIGQITALKILKQFQPVCTLQIMCANGGAIQNISGKQLLGWSERELPLPSGMDQQREYAGINYMESKHGMGESVSILSAQSAGSGIEPFSLPDHDSVLTLVCKKKAINVPKQRLEVALSVAKNFVLTAIGLNDVVPVSARTDTTQPTKTYNLTLNADNIYYANGVLVSNCLTFAWPEMPREAKDLNRESRVKSDYDPIQKWEQEVRNADMVAV